jgi:hypothetical protein
LDILQNDRISFDNVAIASLETIKAMKMDTILNHRTLSRDFFDIATIMEQEKLTIFDLLDSYKQYYTKKLSPTLVLERLTQRDFDPEDPGLHPMKPKSNIHPSKFRDNLAKQIKQQAQKDIKSLDAIISNQSIIKTYLDRKFGLSRMNLPQKLMTLGEDELVLKVLKIGDFDISYKDVSGKTLLDYYLEDEKMFTQILSFAKEIPDSWLQNRTFKRHNLDHLIALENSIVSCATNEYNSDEKMQRIATKHNIEPKELLERIGQKKSCLQALFL